MLLNYYICNLFAPQLSDPNGKKYARCFNATLIPHNKQTNKAWYKATTTATPPQQTHSKWEWQ